MGLVYAVIYYFLFGSSSVKFDFKTPGRESLTTSMPSPPRGAAATSTGKKAAESTRR